LSLAKTPARFVINIVSLCVGFSLGYNSCPCFVFSELMSGFLLRVFRFRRNLLMDNLVLRQQLSVLRGRHHKPKLLPVDKLFWVAVQQFWSGWKQSLILVSTETVVRWHRAGFRLYWSCLSRPRIRAGRSLTDPMAIFPHSLRVMSRLPAIAFGGGIALTCLPKTTPAKTYGIRTYRSSTCGRPSQSLYATDTTVAAARFLGPRSRRSMSTKPFSGKML